MIFDPIAASVAIIRAKASRAASANKPAAAKSPAPTVTARPTSARKKQAAAIPALPRAFERKPVISGRQAYLASIKAPFLSKAAQALGAEIRFGLDARTWIDRNPHVREMLPAILDLAAELEASFRLTEGVMDMAPPVDGTHAAAVDIPSSGSSAVQEPADAL